VCVIDHEKKRCLRRPFCEEPERREADQEQVGRLALGNTERRLEGPSLRVRKEVQSAEQGEQELVKARKGKLGLRKRTRCGHDRRSSFQRPLLRSGEQRGLADSSLAANDEGAAAVLDSVDQRVELGQVSIASEEQSRRAGDSFDIRLGGADAHATSSTPSAAIPTSTDSVSLPARTGLPGARSG
jgi:hypothetical protein